MLDIDERQVKPQLQLHISHPLRSLIHRTGLQPQQEERMPGEHYIYCSLHAQTQVYRKLGENALAEDVASRHIHADKVVRKLEISVLGYAKRLLNGQRGGVSLHGVRAYRAADFRRTGRSDLQLLRAENGPSFSAHVNGRCGCHRDERLTMPVGL